MSAIWTIESNKRYPSRGKDVHVLTCDTWADYFNQARQYTRNENDKRNLELEIRKSITPDKEFANRVEKQRRTIRLGVSKFLSLNHWKYAVSGSKWDMGRVVSGHPEAALRRVKKNSDRTVKILMCTEVQADTHSEAVIIRAAALAELMIALEEQGIKTELVMGFSTSTSGFNGFYESRVKVKAPNTPLNIGLLKYQLEGTSYLYHMERYMILNKFKFDGMGHNPGMQFDADLVIADGNYQDTSTSFSSPEAATQWVKDLFERLSKVTK